MLSNEAAGLVIKVAKGLFKITGRVDQVLAEKEGVEGPLALPVPTLELLPAKAKMRRELRKLLQETRDEDPDPLGSDRDDIQDAVGNDSSRFLEFTQRYLPEQAIAREIDPNKEFMKVLRETHPGLATDPDFCVAAFYIGAGRDFRHKNHTWRLALTVVDVVAEFGADNVDLFTRDKQIQSILGGVLKRFGEADLESIDPTRDLLHAALSATLNGMLDAREFFETSNQWVEALFDALIDARLAVPEAERDNYVLGLLQGRGYPVLVSSILEATAGRLNDDDIEDFRDVAANFLKDVAGIVKQKPRFENFFEDHWGDLLRAGLRSIEKYGPILLKGESPLLNIVLVAVANELSRHPNSVLLSSDAIYGIVDAAASAVAANPELVEDTIYEAWLAALVSSVTSTVAKTGIRATFTKNGVEVLVKDTLSTFAKHPELIIDRPGLARELLHDVLNSLSKAEVLAAEALASAAISGALSALSGHPELIKLKYAGFVASLAGKVGSLVKERQLTKVQGTEVLKCVTEALTENPALFLDIEKRLAGWALDAVVKVAHQSNRFLLDGARLAGVLRGVIDALSKSGKAALKNHKVGVLAVQLEEVLMAGLKRAEKELGNLIGLSSLPDLLHNLVLAWARGEIATIDPENDNFRRLFAELSKITAA
jgi:hypothetical protein